MLTVRSEIGPYRRPVTLLSGVGKNDRAAASQIRRYRPQRMVRICIDLGNRGGLRWVNLESDRAPGRYADPVL